MKRVAGATLLILALLGAGSAKAASLQPIGSFDQPIYVTSDPANPERLFVAERGGRVVEVKGASSAVFADLSAAVGCLPAECAGERGLLSIALPPDFETSGRLYADYAAESDGAIHVVELQSLAPGQVASRPLLTIPHPGASNHYGGQLQMGPEGDLFISTGDGGGSDDEFHNAQNLESLLGKILRIDPSPSGLLPYTVPATNPFAAAAPPWNTIWSYGLRNPFRFSFDRLTGALTIGDVGQGAWEEVDYSPAPTRGGGANYGWNCREGFVAGPGTDEGCGSAGTFTDPIFAYPHEDSGDGGAFGCAIIGGYVSRDPGIAGLYGRYLYGDLCVGKIRSFLPGLPQAGGDRSEGLQVDNLNSFGEDSCGRLYAVSGDGRVYRLVGSQPSSCTAPAPPLAPSSVGIRAARRKVLRNRRVLISVFVNPCRGRRGEPVTLWRGRRPIGTRHLDRVCSARFRPRIRHRSGFRATVRPNATYNGAVSRKLTIKTRHRHRHH